MLFATKYPLLLIDFIMKEMDDGRVRVIADPINAETGNAYTELSRFISKPISRKQIKNARAQAVDELERQYYTVFEAINLNAKSAELAFARLTDAVRNGLVLKSSWHAASTNKNALQYFSRNILPLVMPFLCAQKEFSAPERKHIEEELRNMSLRHSGGRADAAEEALAKHLSEADIILAHLRDIDPSLPAIKLSSDNLSVRAYREEQVKMLPRRVLLKFYELLKASVLLNPKKVFFSVLACFGLRPAEGAAVKPNDIRFFGTYCVCPVEKMEVAGKIVPRLKNRYSYRVVIIPYWGMTLINMCCLAIGEDYPLEDDVPMNNAGDCAMWVQDLLIQAGAKNRDICDIARDISRDDYDFDPSAVTAETLTSAQIDYGKKIACYVLRRCASSIMRNEMGLLLYETDRLLGHMPISGRSKRSKATNVDLNSPETQRKIAEKMERYVFDEEITLNPAFRPYLINNNSKITLIEYPMYVIENSSPNELLLSLNIEAAEAGETIEIEMPNEPNNTLSCLSTPKRWNEQARTVIGTSSLQILDSGDDKK